MALNVEQITSRLAQMPDAMLQKYAAMNKNDPYIVALAVSESNRRKQMRQAAQAQQGMQPQPKVVDSAVQGMAAPMPEDVGIARLPAGDMSFADGGIVAFADGGDVERYNGELGSLTGGTYADTLGFGVSPEQLAMDEYRRAELLRRRKAEEDAARLKFLETAAPETAARLKAEQQPKTAAPTGTTPAAAPVATDKTAPKADTTQRGPGAGPGTPAAPVAPVAPAETGLDALAKRYFGPLEQDIGTLRNQRAELVAGIKDLAAQNLTDTQAAIKARGDVFKGREERLAQREGELTGRKDQNLGLALLQAGAAMMSTPGNLGVALGKGIDVGSRQYVAGIDKLNAAKEKLAEARDRLEDLRINRDDMNDREIRAAQRDIRNAELKGKELIYNGLVSDMGMKRQDVNTMFTAAAKALDTDKEIAARERIAGMLPAEMRGAIMLGTGKTDQEKYLSGAKLLQEATSDKSGMKAVEILASLNAKEAAQGIPPEQRTTMRDLMMSAQQFTAMMYPKVGDNQPTRARPPQ